LKNEGIYIYVKFFKLFLEERAGRVDQLLPSKHEALNLNPVPPKIIKKRILNFEVGIYIYTHVQICVCIHAFESLCLMKFFFQKFQILLVISFFGCTGIQTQGLSLAEQVLCHRKHTPSPRRGFVF
jgi:hypothetical protein